jgi:hypothetical protein
MEERMSSTKRHGTVALVAIGAAVVSFLATVILAPSAYAQQFRGGDELKDLGSGSDGSRAYWQGSR